MENKTIEQLKQELEALTLEIKLKEKEQELNAIHNRKTVRETYNKKRQTNKTRNERTTIYKEYIKEIHLFYFRFKGIATIKQLQHLSDINWYVLKDFELVKVIKFNGTDIFILHAFTMNLLHRSENEKTIKLSTTGLKKQIRRNNWNIKHYKHYDDTFSPLKGIKDKMFIPDSSISKVNGVHLFNNVNYQMLVVNLQIMQAFKKAYTKKTKGNVRADSPIQDLKLIEYAINTKNEPIEKYYEIVEETKYRDTTGSQIKALFMINNQKNEAIRKATKGVKFSPSKEDIREYAITKASGTSYTPASLKMAYNDDIEPYFFFDLFRDHFVGVNYVSKSNNLYFDYLDYSEKIGRNRVIELINKIELLINIAYPNVNLNVVLNIYTNGSTCRRLMKDRKIKGLKKNIKVNYKEFDYSL